MSTPTLDVREAPPLAKPAVGLLAAARVVDLPPDVRWGNGVQWLPELHPSASNASGARALKCQPASIAHTSTDRATIESAMPFMVYAYDWSTSLDRNGRDWSGRARRLLDGRLSFNVATEFWNGTISTANSLNNVHLAKSTATAVTAAAVSPRRALAALDKKIAASLANQPGMIHVTVEMLDLLRAAQAIDADGKAWKTAFGNTVVADGGYSGLRDTHNTETWMIGTSMVEITLGEVDAMTVNTPAEWHAATDQSINDVIVWAQREVLVMHQPNLVFAAAQVDLTAQ